MLLADDFADRKFVRAYTMLSDANGEMRRNSVQVGVKQKQSAAAYDSLLATAQAEMYAFNGKGHDDLWHMDWRARLVRYTMTSDSDSGSGTAGAASIASKLSSIASSKAAGSLADQFSVH